MNNLWDNLKKYIPFLKHAVQHRLADEIVLEKTRRIIIHLENKNAKDLESEGKLSEKTCEELLKFIKSVYYNCKDKKTITEFNKMFEQQILSIEVFDSSDDNDSSVQLVSTDEENNTNIKIIELPKIERKNFAKKSTSRQSTKLFTRRNNKSERKDDSDDSSDTTVYNNLSSDECIVITSDSDDDKNETKTSTKEKSINSDLQEKDLDELEKCRREYENKLFDFSENINNANNTLSPISQKRNSNIFVNNVLKLNPNDPRGKSRVELLYNKNVTTQKDENQNTQVSNIPLPPINRDEILNALNYKSPTEPPEQLKPAPSTYRDYCKKKAAAEAKKKAEFAARRKKEEELEIAKSSVPINVVKKIPTSESCIDKIYRSGNWETTTNLLNNNKFHIPKISSSTASTSSSASIITKIQSKMKSKPESCDTLKKSLIKKRHSISARQKKSSTDSESDSCDTIKIRKHTSKKRIKSVDNGSNNKSSSSSSLNYNGNQNDNNKSEIYNVTSATANTPKSKKSKKSSESDNGASIRVRRRAIQRIESSESEPDNKSSNKDTDAIDDFKNIMKNISIDKIKLVKKLLTDPNFLTKYLENAESDKKVIKEKKETLPTSKSKQKKNEVQRLIEDYDNSYHGRQSCTSTDGRRSRQIQKRAQSDEENQLIEKGTKKRKMIQRHKSCYMERSNTFNYEFDDRIVAPLKSITNEDYDTDEFPRNKLVKKSNQQQSEYIIPKLPIKEVVISLQRLTDEEIVKFTKRPISASNVLSTNELSTLKAKQIGRRRLSRKVTSQFNTNSLHYCENKDLIKFCLVCENKARDMVSHYVNEHYENEVFISRLSKETIDYYKKNRNYGYLIDNSSKYKVDCIFCQNNCIYRQSGFYEHYASHTGEFAYQCEILQCGVKYPYEKEMKQHCKIKHKKVHLKQAYKRLYSYDKKLTINVSICKLCNYVQLNTENIRRHLKTQHFLTTNFENYINNLTLVEFKPFESNELVSIENEKIFENSQNEINQKEDSNISKDNESSSDVDIGDANDEYLETFVKVETDENCNSINNTNDNKEEEIFTVISYSKTLSIDNQPIDKKPILPELNEIFGVEEENLNNNNNTIESQMETSDESTIECSIQPIISSNKNEETNINQPLNNDILKNISHDATKYVSNQERYQCTENFCKYSGKDEKSIEEHFQKIHRRYTAYKCRFCMFEIKNEVKDFTIIKNHLRMHSKKLYACCKCNYAHHDRHMVNGHVRTIHKIEMNITKLTRTVNSNRILNIKFDTLLEDGFRVLNMDYCLICFKNFIGTDNITKHLYDEHKCKVSYQCCYCAILYFTEDDIANHIIGEHKKIIKIRCLYEIDINLNKENNNNGEFKLPEISSVLSLAGSSLDDIPNKNDETAIIKSNKSIDVISNRPTATASSDENMKRKFRSNSSHSLNINKDLISSKKFKLNDNIDPPTPKKAKDINVIPNINKQTNELLKDKLSFELYKCDECCYQSKSNDIINDHKKLDHNLLNSSAGYYCDQCDFFCEMKNELIEHKKTKHSFKPFKCKDCDLQFFNLRHHTKHTMATHLQSSGFFCVECKRFFDTKPDLLQHQINKYGKIYVENNQIECNKCEKLFDNELELKEHDNSEHSLFNCKECKFTCNTKLYLKAHIKEVHEKSLNISCNKENKTSQSVTAVQTTHKSPIHQSSKVQMSEQSVSKLAQTTMKVLDPPMDELESSVQSLAQSTIPAQPTRTVQATAQSFVYSAAQLTHSSVTLPTQQMTTSAIQSTVHQIVQSSNQSSVIKSPVQSSVQKAQSSIKSSEPLVQCSVESVQQIPQPIQLTVQPQTHVPVTTTAHVGTLRLVPIENLVNPNLLNINGSPVRNTIQSVDNIVSQQCNQLSNQNQPLNQGILSNILHNMPSTSIASFQSTNHMNQSLGTNRILLPSFDYTFPKDLIYVCQYCNYEVPDIKILLDHWRTKHKIEKDISFKYSVQRLVRCGYCAMVGTFSTIKKHHFEIHLQQTFLIRGISLSAKFECVECSFSTNYINPFYNHLTNNHFNLINQNEIKQKFITVELLNELLKIGYRAVEYICTICKNTFLEKDIFEKHIIYEHNVTKIHYLQNWQEKHYYSCKECSVMYNTMLESFIHIREKHTKPYKCSVCNDSVSSNQLIIHNNVHNWYNNYQYNYNSIINDIEIYTKNIYIIFPNGLVISLSDLENTNYGNKTNITELLFKIETAETNSYKL